MAAILSWPQSDQGLYEAALPLPAMFTMAPYIFTDTNHGHFGNLPQCLLSTDTIIVAHKTTACQPDKPTRLLWWPPAELSVWLLIHADIKVNL